MAGGILSRLKKEILNLKLSLGCLLGEILYLKAGFSRLHCKILHLDVSLSYLQVSFSRFQGDILNLEAELVSFLFDTNSSSLARSSVKLRTSLIIQVLIGRN
jgi:hypothetical protein